MNNQDKILLAFAAAQAMKTFSESCKNSGIKVSRDVIIETGNKVSETLGVPKNQIAEIGTLIQKGKTQEDIQKIISEKYSPETTTNIDQLISQESDDNNTERESLNQQREKVLEIIEKIKNHYIQEETSMSKNFGKDLEEVYQNGAKTAWKHIKKILRVSQEANSYLDYQDAQTDLELQLNIQCINFNSQINKNDVELYYYYAKYLAQKKGK